MKRLLFILPFLGFSIGLAFGQQVNVKNATASQVIQNQGFSLQVGVPILGTKMDETERVYTPIDLRFPWDIFYQYQTFAHESFDVSKGYFGDKVRINWEFRNNQDRITSVKIFRRRYSAGREQPFELLSNRPGATTEFEDEFAEGGVLYEYKILAEGILEAEMPMVNFITGIGFRSPTATVTGNISFEGGNPVADVTVFAEPTGTPISKGSALQIPSEGMLSLNLVNRPLEEGMAFQAWIKPLFDGNGNRGRIFRMQYFEESIEAHYEFDSDAKALKVDVDGSIFELRNHMPTGVIDARGKDVLVPIGNFAEQFTHFTIALKDNEEPELYINGRKMGRDYESLINSTERMQDDDYSQSPMQILTQIRPVILERGGNEGKWQDFSMGGEGQMIMDEIRLWDNRESRLDSARIRQDYKRYIGGNDRSLIGYFRANEGTGQYAYDLSRTGFEYHKNDIRLYTDLTPEDQRPKWVSGGGNIPNSDQLGVMGITNSNGNYEINAISYAGTGESFNITPVFGQHKFDPAQQMVFLGRGSEVVNRIDFTDISSFVFRGRVLFDSRGVFPSFVETNGGSFEGLADGGEFVSNPGIIDEGYNYYEKGGFKYPKGQYWYNDNGTPEDPDDDYLEEYATASPQDFNILVDGQIVMGPNNRPVKPNQKGEFEIRVPIGDHAISVEKTGHHFLFEGRYPADEGEFKEFFEDATETVYFIDTTKVTIVGKVVGGSVEAEKPIGFGGDGIRVETYLDSEGFEREQIISAINNIGQAELVFAHSAGGSNPTENTMHRFSTHPESGEFRTKVLPLQYEINQLTGLRIPSNPSLSLLEANEEVNFEQIRPEITPEHLLPNQEVISGNPYQYELNFIHRTNPVLRVLSQTFDQTIATTDSTSISTEGMQYPIFTQLREYEIAMSSFERYINFDNDEEVEDQVPIMDGEMIVNNNFALEDSENYERDAEDQSIIHYTFIAGSPAISPPFTRSLDIRLRVGGVDFPAENYFKEGIVLGGQPDGSQTFITRAPEFPDIILRDPPGSNSFAAIEIGESVTLETKLENTFSGGVSLGVKAYFGPEITSGVGVMVKNEAINNVELGIRLETGYTDINTLTKTYTFNQRFATSDDPRFVGSDGDLYIGNSKNYVYGQFDDVQSSAEQIGENHSLMLTNVIGEKAYISTQKAMFFSERPTETFFVYSQHHILNTLIPDLEAIVKNIENGVIQETDPGVLTKAEYLEQIHGWRKTIRDNERSKYLAINDRGHFSRESRNYLENYNQILIDEINNSKLHGDGSGGYEARLRRRLEKSEKLKKLVENSQVNNISFDAGAGEITRSIETVVINESIREFNLQIDENFGFDLGLRAGGIGFVVSGGGFATQDLNAGLREESASTVNISYTLKDDNPFNVFSVNVMNTFDGNGPVFSTLGGSSSCPYEGAEMSHFFNPLHPNEGYPMAPLTEEERLQLSYATQRIEVPQISVEVADLANIPETRNAEFKLILENNSVAGIDGYFELIVDNTSNPNNAIFNINQNGTVVFVPYGERVEYALTLGKSITDVYDYKDIKVILQSLCDPVNTFDEVVISAQFVPSCSQVTLSAPLENWTFNRETAFNLDGSSNPLLINLGDYNRNFGGFERIDLEYRPVGFPTWSRLHTYYNLEDSYESALAANRPNISLIESPNLVFPFDIVERGLADGQYEIRARSTCTNDTEYISNPIRGRVDLNAPLRFGTPSPTDGILSAGSDLKVRFNEPIFYNSAVSLVEIKGQTNQLPVNHEVSLRFQGQENTMIIENPQVLNEDLTIEFWMNNATQTPNATILYQNGGMQIGLENGELAFTLGNTKIKGVISDDGLFHHYTLTHDHSNGDLKIYEESKVVASGNGGANMNIASNNPIIIGGNTFIGNLHSLKIWQRAISMQEAFANMYNKLRGNEHALVGYWPLDEGRGNIAHDLARFKHGRVETDWDIRPKGTAYHFENGQYMTLDNVGFVQMTPIMDATLSFWVKTASGQEGTLFSNGKGDGTDIIQSNGFANKWAVNMNAEGNLSFASEGLDLPLTTTSIADDTWHHITLLLNRSGNLRTLVDAQEVSSHLSTGIGGFSGNKIWIGARGSMALDGSENVDRPFQGQIDELRLWNTLRNVEQISRDRYFEIEETSIGLLLYARMNAPDPMNNNGPRYFHAFSNNNVISTPALLSHGDVNYSPDGPPIKPARNIVRFQVNQIINGDEMILEPVINRWAEIEGQVLDITVHRLFDGANNQQESPITWTAYVQKNVVNWYVEGHPETVDLVKETDQGLSFNIVVQNHGGTPQPYSISGIPRWLNLSRTSGTLAPQSQVSLQAHIDPAMTPGIFTENMALNTDFGFAQTKVLNLRVLPESPNWQIDPAAFNYSMTIIGRVQVNGVFSRDGLDQVAAFHRDEIRGLAELNYDPAYDEYFTFLTVYSNELFDEPISFKIWKATDGNIYEVTLDDELSVPFTLNEVLGSLQSPGIFANTEVLEQSIPLNNGWTWISPRVHDPRFTDFNQLTANMSLHTEDRIQSHSPALLETYFLDNMNPAGSTWAGSISDNGGMTPERMYKVYMQEEQSLHLRGRPVDLSEWQFVIQPNWNWLPFPMGQNIPVRDALATFQPKEGDLIKSQNQFSIYDARNGWSGNLTFLRAGRGYMLRASDGQRFSYPSIFQGNLRTTANTQAERDEDYEEQIIPAALLQLPETMNAIVQLPEPYQTVLVYDLNGLLKGQSRQMEVAGQKLCFLTIYGDQKEPLTFYMSKGIEERMSSTSFDFEGNTLMGTLRQPVVLQLAEDLLQVLPNPFDHSFELKFGAQEAQNVQVELYAVDGRKLQEELVQAQPGPNRVLFQPSLASGVYFLRLQVDGKILHKKIIRK
ncbi:LamG-like jellyroll fold domain-containing protein [Pleomorphovibrio marinus]|uniref:LamG-like jellyroll fold domain-containing protein n=1 Tax=Pleomorphovibrio marinus TaxID=2164132 RepID=UPI000E0AF3BD|nr:LamG-like jellyroll fold domain-containing protein [Pleomorphovibrio marinus]